MFCTECGHENEETALFCVNCGFSCVDKNKSDNTPPPVTSVAVPESKKKSAIYVFLFLLLVVLTSLSVSMLKPSDTVLASQEFVPFSTPFPEPAENMPNLMLDLGGE